MNIKLDDFEVSWRDNTHPVWQAVPAAYKSTVAVLLWEKNTVPQLISRADKSSRTGSVTVCAGALLESTCVHCFAICDLRPYHRFGAITVEVARNGCIKMQAAGIQSEAMPCTDLAYHFQCKDTLGNEMALCCQGMSQPMLEGNHWSAECEQCAEATKLPQDPGKQHLAFLVVTQTPNYPKQK
jgi:hypothetical protein